MSDADWRHLVLVGMTGSGKSTVGRACAHRLGVEFVDADEHLEERAGLSIRTIFDTEGEVGFRDREHQMLAELIEVETPCVIATGGGVVLREANRRLLRDGRCRVVWLRADPEQLVQRVRNVAHRPLLDGDPAASIQRMWVERESLYTEVADAIVSVDHRTVSEVVEAVLR